VYSSPVAPSMLVTVSFSFFIMKLFPLTSGIVSTSSCIVPSRCMSPSLVIHATITSPLSILNALLGGSCVLCSYRLPRRRMRPCLSKSASRFPSPSVTLKCPVLLMQYSW